MREVYRIRNYVKNGGKTSQKLEIINNFVLTKFKNARIKKLPVHDIDLKRWAKVCAKQSNFEFKASNYWISRFKRENRIKSRKVTKFVTYTNLKNSAKIIESSDNFVKKIYNYVSLEEIDIEIRIRNCIIKMHSLIYNQLQSPLFYRMLRYAWFKPGYCNENPEFDNVRDICFKFSEIDCNIDNCIN